MPSTALLRRANDGPPDQEAEPQDPASEIPTAVIGRDRRVAARTRPERQPAQAGVPESRTCGGREEPEAPGQDSGEPLAKVIPMKIFDPFAEADKRW